MKITPPPLSGCIGYAAGHCGQEAVNTLHDLAPFRGHGLISDKLYQNIIKTCDWALPSIACDVLLAEANLQTLELDTYDLYNTCSDPARRRALRAPVGPNTMLARRLRDDMTAVAIESSLGSDPNNCFGSGPSIEAWANQPAVKAALHVAPEIDFALCSSNFTFNYNSDMADERTVI